MNFPSSASPIILFLVLKTSLPPLGMGVAGVEDTIHDNLLHLAWIGFYFPKPWLQIGVKLYVLAVRRLSMLQGCSAGYSNPEFWVELPASG
jgi:hypothetical protein